MGLAAVFAMFSALTQLIPAQGLGQSHPIPDGLDPQLSVPTISSNQVPVTGVEKCKKKRHFTVLLNFVIDEQGKLSDSYLQNVSGNQPDASVLDFALDAIHTDSFSPALRDGVPVAAQGVLYSDIDACVEQSKRSDGEKIDRFTFDALPVQSIHSLSEAPKTIDPKEMPEGKTASSHVGGNISRPVPLTMPEAEYSVEARRQAIEGICLISIVVDRDGLPQNPRVVRPIGHGLDETAIQAVRRYRFRPVMRDGIEPVPVLITIEVNFRLRPR